MDMEDPLCSLFYYKLQIEDVEDAANGQLQLLLLSK